MFSPATATATRAHREYMLRIWSVGRCSGACAVVARRLGGDWVANVPEHTHIARQKSKKAAELLLSVARKKKKSNVEEIIIDGDSQQQFTDNNIPTLLSYVHTRQQTSKGRAKVRVAI